MATRSTPNWLTLGLPLGAGSTASATGVALHAYARLTPAEVMALIALVAVVTSLATVAVAWAGQTQGTIQSKSPEDGHERCDK